MTKIGANCSLSDKESRYVRITSMKTKYPCRRTFTEYANPLSVRKCQEVPGYFTDVSYVEKYRRDKVVSVAVVVVFVVVQGIQILRYGCFLLEIYKYLSLSYNNCIIVVGYSTE
jgi:hypothetical protein